ncbi:MAG: DJ-1/PfpI family protein [Clostridia bacterium]|jgi:4-methyl-5(b-hydroxyethyl)-thiazole monophosphate biosynthesis|nr:DJ-1/PfpI family protein [Clostridia bacterium]MCI2001208.1 DJ-1/PfpI family protein [Clostridia bacterium]MCI2015924.1 DJ-1/PfpI family protein [Clostridia bacterium]
MIKVAIFLADGFEEVEALTQADLLRRAGISVFMVAIKNEKIVKGAHGIKTEADMVFNSSFLERMDALILPGGPGTSNLEAHSELKKLILEFDSERKIIAAICAAPMILGKLGILKNKKACCYPGYEKYLEGSIVENGKVSHDGHIITSRGVGTAVYFALEIIKALTDDKTAAKVKESIVCFD